MCESIADTELKSSDNASINIPFNKKDNGNCIFYFNSKHKPVIFDINGMIITKNPEIESGSIIRVFGSFKFRKEAKKIYAFLNAVMVIERKPSLALKDYHYEKMHTAG